MPHSCATWPCCTLPGGLAGEPEQWIWSSFRFQAGDKGDGVGVNIQERSLEIRSDRDRTLKARRVPTHFASRQMNGPP